MTHDEPSDWAAPSVKRLIEAGDSANGDGAFNDGVVSTSVPPAS